MTIKERNALKRKYNKQQLWEKFKPTIIDYCLKGLDIKLWPKQDEIIRSNARIKVVQAGRNAAKSYNAALITYFMMYFGALLDYKICIYLGGPTADSTRFMWKHYLNFCKILPLDSNKLFGPKMKQSIKSLDTNQKTILTTPHGSKIFTASFNDQEGSDLRGDEPDLICIDEFGGSQYPIHAFWAAYGATSRPETVSLNRMYLCGTPTKGVDAFFDEIFEIAEKDKDMQAWHLTSTDNPYRDKKSDELAKRIGYETFYRSEIEGESVPPAGYLFKDDFNEEMTTRPAVFNPVYEIFIGVDFGFKKPAVVFCQYINNIVYIIHELNPKEILVVHLANKIKQILITKFNSTVPAVVGCDKTGHKRDAQLPQTEFQRFKQILPQAAFQTHSSLTSKGTQVETYKTLMQKNQLVIDPSCSNLLNAFRRARPDTVRQTGGYKSASWQKYRGWDDPLDALVYALINYGPTSLLFLPKETKNRQPTDEQTQHILNFLS